MFEPMKEKESNFDSKNARKSRLHRRRCTTEDTRRQHGGGSFFFSLSLHLMGLLRFLFECLILKQFYILAAANGSWEISARHVMSLVGRKHSGISERCTRRGHVNRRAAREHFTHIPERSADGSDDFLTLFSVVYALPRLLCLLFFVSFDLHVIFQVLLTNLIRRRRMFSNASGILSFGLFFIIFQMAGWGVGGG